MAAATTSVDILTTGIQDEQPVIRDMKSSNAVTRLPSITLPEKVCQVSEWSGLQLGPFGPAVILTVHSASYGVTEASKDVTDIVRAQIHPKKGLKISKFDELFGDPAPWANKFLTVRYSLDNINTHDVCDTKYTEGILGNIGLFPSMVTKVATTATGMVLAGAGYAWGHVEMALFGGQDSCVADSTIFQTSLHSFLLINGIWPSVSYEKIPPEIGERLQACYTNSPTLSLPTREDDIKQTPIIVSNHMSYIDPFVLADLFELPRVLAMAGSLNVPLIGTFGRTLGVIEVERSDSDSRKATAAAIQKHVSSWQPGSRPLLIFPEGTCTNGDDIIDFKQGAFLAGAPVRPVVIAYTGGWHPANVNFRRTHDGDIEQTSDSEWVKEYFGHLVHSLKVKVLPPYIPDDAERADPHVYAANVRNFMREHYKQLLLEVQE